jgi:uncharacterized protein (TIGR03437 family)
MSRRAVFHRLLWALLPVTAWPQVPTYTISTLAGNGLAGFSGDGGAAISAELDTPRGIVSDPAGNVYFCDFSNNRVRKISTTGAITTVAGTGVAGYNGDSIQGTSARLSSPYRVAMDTAGNLYIADPGNNRIRKLAPNGIITTVAGNGNSNFTGDGGPAISASLSYAEDAVIDVYGNMFIADSGNNIIRKVDLNGVITTVAGTGRAAYSGDGGPATQATLNLPVSIAVDPAGDIYISDQGNNVVRKVDTNGMMSTVAGNGNVGFAGDGGSAKNAEFYNPAGLALDAADNLYITDVGNNRIRLMLTSGNITTIAGDGAAGSAGDGGPALSAQLNAPRSVGVGTFGSVYIADFSNNKLRLLTPTGTTVGLTTNAFGNVRVLAANSWVALRGTNLSPTGDSRTWQTSDFVNNLMPTSLDGVSVTMNGVKAYIYYISPTQLNILTPPNLTAGTVQIQVTNGSSTSAPAVVEVQQYSPSFFVFNGGPYAIAEHLNGGLAGPATLFPGLSTPAAPGEEIVFYANGFGPTSTPVTAGASVQSGTLPASLAVTIGGFEATVKFAGLISPGLYQFNVVVPLTVPNGDAAVIATYNGATTQTGVLLTVSQ